MILTRIEKIVTHSVLLQNARYVLVTLLFLAAVNFGYANNNADTSRAKTKTKKTVVVLSNNAPDTNALKKCENIDVIRTVIGEAIAIGAPTYNEGNVLGCYRIYEGAAYKVLYKYSAKCKEVKKILEAALEKSYGDYTAAEKAWIMRMAFDSILGEPTVTTKSGGN